MKASNAAFLLLRVPLVASFTSIKEYCTGFPRSYEKSSVLLSRVQKLPSAKIRHSSTSTSSINNDNHLDSITPLSQILRVSGKVEHGFGRGGKKLGVPTANLGPSSELAPALEVLQNGVYVGWSRLLQGSSCYPTVVNIGISPTFVGEENAQKIIEAHLMQHQQPPLPDDFYGNHMKLLLVAFSRPEKRFESFDELVAQIHCDLEKGRRWLSVEGSPWQRDSWLLSTAETRKTYWKTENWQNALKKIQ